MVVVAIAVLDILLRLLHVLILPYLFLLLLQLNPPIKQPRLQPRHHQRNNLLHPRMVPDRTPLRRRAIRQQIQHQVLQIVDLDIALQARVRRMADLRVVALSFAGAFLRFFERFEPATSQSSPLSLSCLEGDLGASVVVVVVVPSMGLGIVASGCGDAPFKRASVWPTLSLLRVS